MATASAPCVRKEFLALLKDPRSRFVLIVPPIIQLLVFGYAATFDLNHIPYAVYNEDGGAASRELLAAFQRLAPFPPGGDARRRRTRSRRWSTRGMLLLVLHVGPQFSRDLLSGQPAPLQVIVDGRNSNTAHDRAELRAHHRRRPSTRTGWPRADRRARRRGSRRAPGSTPTWRAAGSSCPASSACSRCWSPCWSPRCRSRASASRAPSTSCWSRRCGRWRS